MHHLVLADDSVTIQKVVELTFAEEDFQVHAFSDGASALEYLQNQPVDVLLADIFLPFVDGYDLCRAVRQNERTAHIPVILLAGTFEPFDLRRAERAGYTSHITKPFETSYLVEQVTELVARVEQPPVRKPEVSEPPPQEEVPGQVFTFPLTDFSNGQALRLRAGDCLASSSLLRRDALVGPRIRYQRQGPVAAPVVDQGALENQTTQTAEEAWEAAETFETASPVEPTVEAAPPEDTEAQPVESPAAENVEETWEAAETLETASPVEPTVEAAPAEDTEAPPSSRGTAEETWEAAEALETASPVEPTVEAAPAEDTGAQPPVAEAAGGLTEEQLNLIAQKIMSRLPQELARWLPEVADEVLRPGKREE
jgi:CheY-like chemotaxis protein